MECCAAAEWAWPTLPHAWAFSPWTQYRGRKTLRLSGAEQSDDIVRATM
ncbi:hypothetical protein [Intestinimonas sp.]